MWPEASSGRELAGHSYRERRKNGCPLDLNWYRSEMNMMTGGVQV